MIDFVRISVDYIFFYILIAFHSSKARQAAERNVSFLDKNYYRSSASPVPEVIANASSVIIRVL